MSGNSGNAKQNNQRKQKNQVAVTWAQAFRDIIITAMNRGQLLLLMVTSIFMLLIWKLESNQAFDLLNNFLEKLKNWSIIGWILWVLTVFGCFILFRKVRTDFSYEMKRVGKEKSKAQEKALQRSLPSSDRKR
ncbi:hypothetical protein [Neisseria wadsworthii]|uniref:hypothetical protein n=1 Tax=Neisseria wadsworthii TaxID=607711 RepID=UPI000D3151E2|nr:hypothetical protein [Neisseria wadsworthii]